MDRQKKIVNMFNNIAPTYDIANRLLSFGVDKSWRKKAVVKTLKLYKERDIAQIVDVACGTGDMSAYWLTKGSSKIAKVSGVDPSTGMLEVAKRKHPNIEFINSEAINLPFESESVDILSITYGIRNVVERERAFKEFFRVLKKDGLLVILEFMKQDEKRFTSHFTNFYTKKALPFIGGLISGDREAYRYLPESIEDFITTDELKKELKIANLETIYVEDFSFGISTLTISKKL